MWHDRYRSKVTVSHPLELRKQTPTLRALAIGLACLGVCVFAWGLKYKLSLYDPPQSSSHHMAAASAASALPSRKTWVKCSALPAPPEAMTGIRTASLTAA